MENYVIIAVVALLVALVTVYLVRSRKHPTCIGCPYADKCAGNCTSEKGKE